MTSGGSSGIGPTEIPDEFVQFMLHQTNGSAIERERIASELRQALMAAPVVPGGNERRPAFVGPPATQMSATGTARIANTLPRFVGFQDVQHPEEFLNKVDNFCLINGIALEDRVRRVFTTALDGSAKLWHRFAGPFATWDAFVTAFRRKFASADEKKRLKEELEARTQHPEENLKEFIYVISELYDRIGEEVADDVKVDRVLRRMHPQLQDLVAGSTFSSLKALADAADGLMERVRRRLQYRPPPPKTNQVACDLAYSAHCMPDAMAVPQHSAAVVSAPNAGWTVPGGNERRPAFVGPPATQMSATGTAPIANTLPRFVGFQDVQHPEEFLNKVDNFCLINGIALEDRVRRVFTAALDGSAKLWHRFAGPFATWDAFVTAFRRKFASADEKKRLKEELEARTQHPEENLKEFIYVISELYDRIGEKVADDVKVDRVLRRMHPPAAGLGSGVHLLKLEGPGGCGRWPDGASAAPATISASSTQNKSGRVRLGIFGTLHA
ncbi:hypothetical protein MRX96_020264 [Rhipicephalus microplus]